MRLGDDRHLGSGEPDAMIGTAVGPFTIVRSIGAGGMSRVYLAEHSVLRTLRAVKLLSPHLAQHALLVRRFVNEARAAARLRHRNLIQVHDVGRLASGVWYMVLDYLEGDTLARFIASHAGPISPDAIARVVCEIANGLQVAHDHDIVHRDLKPENVFLVACGSAPHQAVVLDFGVAQLGDDPEASGTPPGMAVGTPVYMPPEQLRGGRVSPAADVFALGVIAYRMTTGGWFPYQDGDRAAYCALSASELYHRQLTRPPIDPRERCPGITAAWASAILAAISPDPAARPASARAFALRLVEAVPPLRVAPGGLPIVPIVASYGRELAEARAVESRGAGSRYQLGAKLGAGGMAEVFVGTMVGVEGFARPVAIKRVLAGLSQVPAFATMFVAEAQIASRLAHPNVVSVLDFSRDSADRLFLVMEHVDGKDLASVLEAGPIAPPLALFIAVELLRGLGYAHDLPDPVSGMRGVVHRDVSPQNLLLSYEGAVKVSDFGLAKARAASEGVCSATVRGKPRYMSPEQVAGEPLDGRTDLYAVGVMLWEMLAHRPLYGGTAKEILAQVMFKDVPAPGGVRRGVPADLAAVAMKLLARDREDRYPTAAAAIEALLACDDVPRDGRGELAAVLAERFPRHRDAERARRGQRRATPVQLGARRELRAAVITAPSPPSAGGSGATASLFAIRRPPSRRIAATLSGAVLGVLVVAVVVVVAGGQLGTSRTGGRVTGAADARLPAASEPGVVRSAATGPAHEAARARGIAPSGPAVRGPDAAAVGVAGPRAARPARKHAVRTGELAILVRPWALIWLNGRPRGQTPFRAAVPAGRYQVRIVNDDVGQLETTIVVVEAGRTATLERSW
jgi:eukaryotic-like serine/threonine-protein kinase